MERSAARITELLQKRSELDDDAFLGLVGDAFATARLKERRTEIEAEYERYRETATGSRQEDNGAGRGALGYFYFCFFAERWGKTHDPADQARADKLLDDQSVRSFLFELYDIPAEFRDSHLALHALGTTSFIIKTRYFQNRYHRVVKLIKPWYFSDPVIAAQTRASKEEYDRRLSRVTMPDLPELTVSPFVEYANRHCIVMAFVEGETLHDVFMRLWLNPGEPSGASAKDAYAELSRLMRSLCAVLKACNQASIAHGDLSTTNILVERTGTELPRLRLIDFGINYLLTRNLGEIDGAPLLIATVDPYVMKRKYDAVPTVESDVYSLGVILTEGFLGGRYRDDGLQVLLDEVYDRHAGVGAILDDLLDPDPFRRLTGLPAGEDPYDFIARRIDFELRAVSSLDNTEPEGRFQFLEEILGAVFPGLKDIVKLGARTFRNRNRPPGVPQTEPRPRLELPVFERADLLVPTALNILIVSLVLSWIAPWDAIIQGEAGLIESISEHWAAWVVTLACSIVASRYVISLFAGLAMSGLPRWLVISTTLCVFAPWIPLLLILFRYPDDWLLLVAIGGTVIVANTVLWFLFCRSAGRTLKRRGIHASPSMDATVFSLRGWTETSVITLVCVYAVAILVRHDVLHDITFYAVIIAGVICTRIFFSNLHSDAPKIRTGLQRFSNGYRRARVDPDRQRRRAPRSRKIAPGVEMPG